MLIEFFLSLILIYKGIEMKVLVTSAGALLGQGIIRSLQECKFKPNIVACDPDPRSPGLYWNKHSRLIPLAKDPHFIEKFSDLLNEEKPDAVCVGTDPELSLLAANQQALESAYKTKIIVSSPEVVRIADDKYLTYQFMKDNGFTPPDSRLPGQEQELVKLYGFPLVVKPRIGARSVGFHLVKNQEELTKALAEVSGAVVQECLGTKDDEYTAGTLYFDKDCRATIVMRRELRDGNTFKAYVDKYTELNEQVRAFCNALKPFGPANFQFRLVNGIAKVFEINSRFSGTTPLRMHAGFNELEMTLEYLFFNKPIVQPNIPKLTIMRHWTETIIADKEIITR
jgi:carbamoyl-phosphate synthase large subunit